MRTVENPRNPWESVHREWIGPAPPALPRQFEEEARSILSRNDSPDLPFRYSVNPYRGCQHACAYCYARPTHEYLGFGAGTDFDTAIVVKRNAAELLDAALRRRGWSREVVAFSGVTDCYQPLESVWRLTRRCLEVCLRHRNPVAVVTKSALIRRDIDVLRELQRVAGVQIHVSLAFADPDVARWIEPAAASPRRRLETVHALAEVGLEVGILLAPIIPGLNDSAIPELLSRAREHGATSASFIALRLPGSVEEVFRGRLREEAPLRAARVESRIREVRGGRWNESRYGRRFRGEGVYWDSIQRLFEIHCRKQGFEPARAQQPRDPSGLQPARAGTPSLWDDSARPRELHGNRTFLEATGDPPLGSFPADGGARTRPGPGRDS